MTTREPGYYWVKFYGSYASYEWYIARWGLDGWWRIYNNGPMSDAAFAEIDERRIDREETADTLQDENKRLRHALSEIDALPVLEINQYNYIHDGVCELNNNAIQASLIARTALQPQAGEAKEHD